MFAPQHVLFFPEEETRQRWGGTERDLGNSTVHNVLIKANNSFLSTSLLPVGAGMRREIVINQDDQAH